MGRGGAGLAQHPVCPSGSRACWGQRAALPEPSRAVQAALCIWGLVWGFTNSSHAPAGRVSAFSLQPCPGSVRSGWAPAGSRSRSQSCGQAPGPVSGRPREPSGDTGPEPLLPQACSSSSSPQFVLKHSAFAHLREVAPFPNTLNPHEAESLALVGAMIDQVLELHGGARWLHIGCDEVGAVNPRLQPSPPWGCLLACHDVI